MRIRNQSRICRDTSDTSSETMGAAFKLNTTEPRANWLHSTSSTANEKFLPLLLSREIPAKLSRRSQAPRALPRESRRRYIFRGGDYVAADVAGGESAFQAPKVTAARGDSPRSPPLVALKAQRCNFLAWSMARGSLVTSFVPAARGGRAGLGTAAGGVQAMRRQDTPAGVARAEGRTGGWRRATLGTAFGNWRVA